MSQIPGLRYQPEVDGLRAVAVVPVILFHAGISAFSGGFVGVDVFFVISGYLITGIIAADLDRGKFTLGNFYQRRVRRILPALFVVMLFSLAAGLLLFLPDQLTSLSQSALAALGFVSNIWLWGQAGYFMGDARMFPLLHTWSLSLEEQFYIFFPPLMMIIARWKLPRIGIILALFGGSLALAAVGAYVKPSASFYLLPTRAWELMLGAAIALGAVRTVTVRVREMVGWLALALVLVPVLSYNEQTPFPGLAALPPCLGTAMLIVAGRDGGCQVTRALSAKPIVWIGLISYSLYLWHWPLFVFARQITLQGELSAPVIAVCIALAFLLATATWRWVEQPFRDRRRITVGQLSAWVIGGALAIAGVALVAIGGLPQRMAPSVTRYADGGRDRTPYRDTCLFKPVKELRAGHICRLGEPGKPGSVLLWGDSHADAISPAIDSIARRSGTSGLNVSHVSCPPVLGLEVVEDGNSRGCRAWNDAVRDQIRASNIDTVILFARWAVYAHGKGYGPDANKAVTLEGEMDRPLLQGLEKTMRLLQGRDVILILSTPEIGFDVPTALARKEHAGFKIELRPTLEDHRTRQAIIRADLISIARKYNAKIIDPASVLCARHCQIQYNGRPIYYDSSHLSRHGALTLVPWLELQLSDAPVLSDGI